MDSIEPLVVARQRTDRPFRRLAVDFEPRRLVARQGSRATPGEPLFGLAAIFLPRLAAPGPRARVEFFPVPRRGVEVAADIDQPPSRLLFEPRFQPVSRRLARRVKIVGKPDDAVGPLPKSRRQPVPTEHAMPGLLEQLAEHPRAVDALFNPETRPVAVGAFETLAAACA